MSGSDPKPNGAEADPAKLLPIEAARASLMHWWREPFAGLVSLAAGLYDTWHFGKDAGLSTNVDELLVIGGILLIAGGGRLSLSGPPVVGQGRPDKGPGP